jgi:hypothetical protein
VYLISKYCYSQQLQQDGLLGDFDREFITRVYSVLKEYSELFLYTRVVRLLTSVGSRFCAEANVNYARGDFLHAEKTVLLRPTACSIISSSTLMTL